MISVFTHNDVKKQIQYLYGCGGHFQKAAEKCKSLLWDLKNSEFPADELKKIPLTNHGETRIKHCVKYDLPGYCRLVTIQDNGYIILIYVGTHDQVDKWLNSNAGKTIAVNNPEQGLFELLISDDINNPNSRINPIPDYSSSFLYEKLKQYWSQLADGIPTFIQKHLMALDTSVDDEEILELAQSIESIDKQELIFDVFMALRGGLVDEAKNRILAYGEQIKLISEVPIEIVNQVSSNDNYLNLDDLDEDDLKILMSNKNWLEWMLFMHPAQKQVVDRDFSGSARLLGVSGSGKTCVVVRRAVRLAKKYPNEKILILTLNQALAGLISQMVDQLAACSGSEAQRENVVVKSFWELCRELLINLRNEPFDTKILGPKTHKLDESIEEVWNEFYKCENNNDDADVLFPLHQNLLARDIYPSEYLKQELDWIRSFMSKSRRREYINIPRENRAIQFLESDRELVLQSLDGWEQKMSDVGAIDYLGLTNELYEYYDGISPMFRSILVDEVQDFGTLELSIIRKLTNKAENDLFICGDIAQQVYNKHHQIRVAGITILPDAYLKILKNYRNSREILAASYAVLTNNVEEAHFKSEDFEVLRPEYANFSSPKPFLRRAKSLKEEFYMALSYLNSILEEKEKACIAICNFSIFEVEPLGKQVGLPILNGNTKIGSEKIYISDLEQTKGFEFDRMIVINASFVDFPNPKLPIEERYREISKFYVAMTRAKKELIISFSVKPSYLFDNCGSFFVLDNWESHSIEISMPKAFPIERKQSMSISDLSKHTGKTFLYSNSAIGTSKELQNKIIDFVAEKSITDPKGKKIGWKNMGDLKADIDFGKDKPHYSRIFGPIVYVELINLLKSVSN